MIVMSQGGWGGGTECVNGGPIKKNTQGGKKEIKNHRQTQKCVFLMVGGV